MPCYDHRSSPEYIAKHTVDPLKERVNKYADWLCWLLTDREARWLDKTEMPADLVEWAAEHEKFDKERK
jgi:hypothetical protein